MHVYDDCGVPYMYIGSNNPPHQFKEKWGHFLVYAWGFDRDNDTNLKNWDFEISSSELDGDYYIYSDKQDFVEYKKAFLKDNFDYVLTTSTIAQKVHITSPTLELKKYELIGE